jgi:rubrerythrin
MYNADEILEIAVTIERNANAFYTRAAEVVSGEEAKSLFHELAAWEVGHVDLFEGMRAKFAAAKEQLWLPDLDNESGRYLQAIADGKIFDVRRIDEELAALTDDPHAILMSALQREKDAVIFYLALKEMVPENLGKDDVQKIIEEEMSHVRYIADRLAAMAS